MGMGIHYIISSYVFEIFHRKVFKKINYTNTNKNIPTEQGIYVLKNHILYWNTWPDYAMDSGEAQRPHWASKYLLFWGLISLPIPFQDLRVMIVLCVFF